MSPDRALAVFFAEFRSTVRRVRTLVFVAVAAAGLVGTIALAALATSEVAPLAGAYAPRFVLSVIGNVWLWPFLIATVFMAFDARQQDERARVAEVLDAKPVSNLALLGGRLAATVAVAWLALVGIAALVQAGGTVSRMVHEASGNETASLASLAWWLAVTVEPASLVTLVTVDALPGLALVTALVLFLAAALRRRALTIVVALAVVALHGYAVANVPMFLLPAVSLVASYANFASDVVPTFADPAVLVQRAALVLFAAALLTGAAALHPRDDGGARSRRGIVAILLAAVGGAAITGVVAAAASDLTVREEWLAAQEEARDLTFPDLRHVRGEVRIEPGRDLAIDLELRLAAPLDGPLERLHFSLNPGVEVSAVEIAGEAANTTHVDGILTVDLRETLAPATELSLSLRANGVPDERFAYLDSTVDWRRLPASNKLVLLGTDALVFSGAYVALTPGAAWLPTAGPNLADRSPDTFTADLVVRVPETWLVAGPGRRETVAPGVFRFRPATMVPDVGLFAARFERRAVEAGGVTLELLVVPEHAGHLDGLGEVMEGEDGIIARVGEMLDTARDQGLPYPYAGLSMVEIPARLRRYGGGRELDTALFPPGLVLVPEYGFPTRFERVYMDRRINFRIGPSLSTETADRRQGMLWRLFAYEGAGGEPHHVARNIVAVRSATEAPGAIALDALCRVLAARIVWRLYGTESNVLFTAHGFAGESVGANPLRSLVWGGGPSPTRASADRPSVWEAAERTALANLGDIGDAGLAMDVLALRIDQAANTIRDRYGLDKVAAMLVELRRRSAGISFSADEFRQVSAEAGMDLDALLGDWLNATDMPGFRASTAEVFRIRDNDDGEPRYQVLVDVWNGEPVPGVIRLTYVGSLAGIPNARRENSDPVPVAAGSAVRIGQILDQLPDALWLRTYLSRNRADLHLPVPVVDTAGVVDRAPVTGVEPSDWRPPNPGIVVDDLGQGFAVESTTGATRLGDGLTVADQTETDRGLPVYQFDTRGRWARQPLPTAWGQYRRTAARINAGQGSNRATFDAELPEAGRWRLSYHVPSLRMIGLGREVRRPSDEQGVYHLEITNAGTATTVAFDAAAATQGWNEVDVLDLAAGPVRVAVSDKTSGGSVIADAIRWERR